MLKNNRVTHVTQNNPDEFIRRMFGVAVELKDKIRRLKKKSGKKDETLLAKLNTLNLALSIFDRTVTRIEPIKRKLLQDDFSRYFSEAIVRSPQLTFISFELSLRNRWILLRSAFSPALFFKFECNRAEIVIGQTDSK